MPKNITLVLIIIILNIRKLLYLLKLHINNLWEAH